MDSTALWVEYTTKGSAVAREKLLNEHLGLVHHVARQLSKTLSADVDFDELVSCGVIGLMNALDSFDPSRGLAFSTFAAPRIRGAILDELRRQDHVPRSIRKKSRDIGVGSRGAHPQRSATRRPTRSSPSTSPSTSTRSGAGRPTWKASSTSRSTSRRPRTRRAPPRRASCSPASMDGTIEDELNFEEEVGVLRDAIMELKEQERVVLSLYYFEELKLHEIATILELTESRISQIRSKAIQKLRVRMGALREAGRMSTPASEPRKTGWFSGMIDGAVRVFAFGGGQLPATPAPVARTVRPAKNRRVRLNRSMRRASALQVQQARRGRSRPVRDRASHGTLAGHGGASAPRALGHLTPNASDETAGRGTFFRSGQAGRRPGEQPSGTVRSQSHKLL